MTETKRALVVGEPEEWRERVCASLALAGLTVERFASGRRALERLDATIQLVVIAALSSDVSGIALCRRLRELPGGGEAFATIVVSSLGDEMDRVLAFENGADDFVVEPFSPRELTARVRAILRRRQQRVYQRREGEIEAGPLRLDLITGIAEQNGCRVRLTAREFEVLRQLIASGGRVVRRSELLEDSGSRRPSERLVDTHVKSIRRKLGAGRHMIETVRGIGYRFEALGEPRRSARARGPELASEPAPRHEQDQCRKTPGEPERDRRGSRV